MSPAEAVEASAVFVMDKFAQFTTTEALAELLPFTEAGSFVAEIVAELFKLVQSAVEVTEVT